MRFLYRLLAVVFGRSDKLTSRLYTEVDEHALRLRTAVKATSQVMHALGKGERVSQPTLQRMVNSIEAIPPTPCSHEQVLQLRELLATATRDASLSDRIRVTVRPVFTEAREAIKSREGELASL